MSVKRRAALGLVCAYLVALAASHLWRGRLAEPTASSPPPLEGLSTVLLPGIDGGDDVTVAYRRACALDSSGGERPWLVMLHGSPGSSRDFESLGSALSERYCVLAPDLPGFGRSTRNVSDYSIRAHARYVDRWLDELGVSQAHVLGFSMGGGVALELAHRAPERVRSLTLLSAIGVQEAELLGNYHLNHAVHGAQLAALWLLHEATPHFGALDDSMLSLAYARNFYDTDQRPLRAILEALEVPVLIVHGRKDPLVPIAAATEHHRIVPHSELVVFDASHFMVFRSGEMLAAPVGDFLDRVEAGSAPGRAEAQPDRLARSTDDLNPQLLPRARGVALFVLMSLLALATFVSEDLTSIGAGLLVAQGRIGYLAASFACFVGIFVSDLGLYLIGRFLGRPWLSRAPLKWWISEEAVYRGRAWFDEKGPSVVFASRFLPGTRVATYVAGGVLATPFWRFALLLAAAAAAWVPLLVGAAYLAGVRVLAYFEIFRRWAIPGAIALAVLAWLLLRLVHSLASYRGRRLLVGRWRRLRSWEFWPSKLFYLPVLAGAAVSAVRHRGLTVFTAANPAMPAGGFVGESKAAILEGLAAEHVAPFCLIRPGDAGARPEALAFARASGGFPLVWKPDVGERGRGVRILRSDAELDAALASLEAPVVLQRFVPGPELGVFYVRKPGSERGEIFSITDKRHPEVVGDGRRTLERLILDDRRAVAMARVYLKRLREPGRVPAAGERVPLTEIGTHCLGAVFLDGRCLKTPALEESVDRIARSLDGFYFGRFDLKAPSYEAFERGERLQVLELNGVTSEATHIYDPGSSLWSAYRTLFRQWDLAFEIGKMNRDRGVEPAGVAELVRLVWKHAI